MNKEKPSSKSSTIQWPVSCPSCGRGEILPKAKPGRKARYKNMDALPIPEDLAVPTCNHCGHEWIDRSTAAAVDAALEKEYQARLYRLALADLDRLAELRITQQRLERLLGLSQGYLSKIRSGSSRPSPVLVGCLHLLASDPESRIQEMDGALRGE